MSSETLWKIINLPTFVLFGALMCIEIDTSMANKRRANGIEKKRDIAGHLDSKFCYNGRHSTFYNFACRAAAFLPAVDNLYRIVLTRNAVYAYDLNSSDLLRHRSIG